jgi:hypothetical protein
MSERLGREVATDDAVRDYVATTLPLIPDEQVLLEEDAAAVNPDDDA